MRFFLSCCNHKRRHFFVNLTTLLKSQFDCVLNFICHQKKKVWLQLNLHMQRESFGMKQEPCVESMLSSLNRVKSKTLCNCWNEEHVCKLITNTSSKFRLLFVETNENRTENERFGFLHVSRIFFHKQITNKQNTDPLQTRCGF